VRLCALDRAGARKGHTSHADSELLQEVLEVLKVLMHVVLQRPEFYRLVTFCTV
jgi:hypothetical protein